jgi:hypothetical protein
MHTFGNNIVICKQTKHPRQLIEWFTSGCCLHFEAQRWLVVGLLGELGADDVGDLQSLVLRPGLGDEAADDGEDALEICKSRVGGSIPHPGASKPNLELE